MRPTPDDETVDTADTAATPRRGRRRVPPHAVPADRRPEPAGLPPGQPSWPRSACSAPWSSAILYTTKSRSGPVQDPAVVSAASTFLTDFFNFNAKTVDSDFNAVTAWRRAPSATQAQQFFNSSIRKALEQALRRVRGQIRYLAVQSENQGAGTASVYAVVDQTYVNNKITSPQADVVRLDRRPAAGRTGSGRSPT